MTRMALAALAAALSSGALAERPASPPEERLICRGGERQLSSRIRTARRCRTAEQWRLEDEAANRLPPSLQVTQGQNDGRAPAQPH
ncbi:MAG TPA: hypothetical protein VD887_01985 [Allosphingosinicella sp.]|nr:hypothetical protein [Allosphingosinicella sp.]HYG28961.1 hypothetical protein [Allosphingosinicella sp.]